MTLEKSECLRKQYVSVYTKANPRYRINDPDVYFEVSPPPNDDRDGAEYRETRASVSDRVTVQCRGRH